MKHKLPEQHKKRETSPAKRKIFLLVGLLLTLFVVSAIVKFIKITDRHYPWIWSYVVDQLVPKEKPKTGPTHVMFLFADHFEPHNQATVDRWMENYPKLALKHHDADGKHLQHSWFWYFDKSDDQEKLSFLQQLAKLAYRDLGEVEVHLHHFNDDEDSFLKKMKRVIELSQQTGALITREVHPRTAFGFIHGGWGLDNSRGPVLCGVNNELILLRKLGCYADFTHPSWGPMHPRIVNRLYFATDDPNRPKSYDTGKEMQVGVPGIGDLLIFEGPSVVHFRGLKLAYDHGNVSLEDLPTPERIDEWIKTRIHVRGRPEWIFVKVFAHGALSEDHEAVLGEWADKMYSYLEQHYNDGTRFVLHYVTAREAYNIATAAEAGKSGNPNEFRNFTLPPYVNRFLATSTPYEVISMTETKAVIKFLVQTGSRVALGIRAHDVNVSGDADVVESHSTQDETLLSLATKGAGIVGFTFGEAKQ